MYDGVVLLARYNEDEILLHSNAVTDDNSPVTFLYSTDAVQAGGAVLTIKVVWPAAINPS